MRGAAPGPRQGTSYRPWPWAHRPRELAGVQGAGWLGLDSHGTILTPPRPRWGLWGLRGQQRWGGAGHGGAWRGEESLSSQLPGLGRWACHTSFLQEPAGGWGWGGFRGHRFFAPQTHPLSPWQPRLPPSDPWVGAGVLGCVCWGTGEVMGPKALTGAQLLLQERDLLAQRVDAVQLLEGVGQEAAWVRESVLQGSGGQAVQWGQHELQLLWGGQGPGEPGGRPV